MARYKPRMLADTPAQRLRPPPQLSRITAALAFILLMPLFIVITLALLLHGQWPVIMREEFTREDGQILLRLVFNTRAASTDRKLRNEDRLTGRGKLAEFLRETRIAELPGLFHLAFSSNEIDWATPIPRGFVSWESLSAWANVNRVPQLRYGDLLMIRFNEACNDGNISMANTLYKEIESDLRVPVTDEDDDSRRLINQYWMGYKRLTFIEQRLWHLRNPEPGQTHY